jgi:hypothetical protein
MRVVQDQPRDTAGVVDRAPASICWIKAYKKITRKKRCAGFFLYACPYSRGGQSWRKAFESLIAEMCLCACQPLRTQLSDKPRRVINLYHMSPSRHIFLGERILTTRIFSPPPQKVVSVACHNGQTFKCERTFLFLSLSRRLVVTSGTAAISEHG